MGGEGMPEKRLRSRVKVVSKPAQLDSELEKAADRLVVLEFFSESISPCRKMQEAIASLSLEHTSAVFIRVNLDIWEEIEEFIPRFNSDPGRFHADDGNPNVYIDPSKKLVMYAHVKSSDTVLQRYDVKGLPTILLLRGEARISEIQGADMAALELKLNKYLMPE